MSEEKTEVQKAMEKDCIILFTTKEVLSVVRRILGQARPGWSLPMEIDVKCRGPDCASYNVFTNKCGLR